MAEIAKLLTNLEGYVPSKIFKISSVRRHWRLPNLEGSFLRRLTYGWRLKTEILTTLECFYGDLKNFDERPDDGPGGPKLLNF